MTLLRIGCVMALVLSVIDSAAAEAPSSSSGVRRVTVEDAVRMALENNLGIHVARVEPQLQDLNVAQARASWSPTFTSTLQSANADSPNNSFLSGTGTTTSDARINSNFGLAQTLPWGGSYSVGWDSLRSTTNNVFSNFSPQLRSSLALSYRQPLLRGFSIDTARQQVLVSEKNREIADVSLRETIALTSRAVRHAYWDLVFAIASLDVQRQSLDLAAESLRNTRARIEIGTTAPIDSIEAEAEVALREEAVVLDEAQVATAEDALRTLVYDPSAEDFWTFRIEPADLPPFMPAAIDVEAAMRTALERRSDLQQSRKGLETQDVNMRYSRNQALPDVTASFDYGLTGLGGTRFLRGQGFPGPIIGETQRGLATVLGDLFGNDFPSWTASLNVSYPIGTNPQEVALARTRLEFSQQQIQLRNAELQVAAQVREAGRQALTNQRRVDTTAVSRKLSERRLEAEEHKLAAGTSTSFFVFQAQRDLAQARNNELRAIIDYERSIVDFETVQEAPLR
jgi:outer membrane protein TolC